MTARNRGPPMPMKGMPPGVPPSSVHESHLGKGLRPLPPHPALLEEMREPPFGMDPRFLPPHPLIIEERLAAQHEEIQALLADNQRLAATHVALKQELEAAHHELQSKRQYADALHAEKDVQMRELHDKAMRLELDLRGLEGMRNELLHVRTDIKDLSAAREELGNQVQVMTRDLGRYNADMQRIPALKTDIETTKQELQRARAAIEYEKKGYAKNYEHGRVMEKKLLEMARELEKLRAEIATAEMRASAASAANNPGVVYNANYANPEVAYGNPYYGYGMNPVQAQATTESYPQYGHAPGSWGAYDMQQVQGHR